MLITELFAYLDVGQYVEAALHFLRSPCSKQSGIFETKDVSKISPWETNYVEFNEETGNFTWRVDNGESWMERCDNLRMLIPF